MPSVIVVKRIDKWNSSCQEAIRAFEDPDEAWEFLSEQEETYGDRYEFYLDEVELQESKKRE